MPAGRPGARRIRLVKGYAAPTTKRDVQDGDSWRRIAGSGRAGFGLAGRWRRPDQPDPACSSPRPVRVLRAAAALRLGHRRPRLGTCGKRQGAARARVGPGASPGHGSPGGLARGRRQRYAGRHVQPEDPAVGAMNQGFVDRPPPRACRPHGQGDPFPREQAAVPWAGTLTCAGRDQLAARPASGGVAVRLAAAGQRRRAGIRSRARRVRPVCGWSPAHGLFTGRRSADGLNPAAGSDVRI